MTEEPLLHFKRQLDLESIQRGVYVNVYFILPAEAASLSESGL